MDTKLQNYVDQVFIKYDYDRSGFLNLNQIAGFFNQCLSNSGSHRRVTQAQATQYMRNMDQNMDGRITKLQLYSGLKAILNQQQGYMPSQDQPRTDQFYNQGHCNNYNYNTPNRVVYQANVRYL